MRWYSDFSNQIETIHACAHWKITWFQKQNSSRSNIGNRGMFKTKTINQTSAWEKYCHFGCYSTSGGGFRFSEYSWCKTICQRKKIDFKYDISNDKQSMSVNKAKGNANFVKSYTLHLCKIKPEHVFHFKIWKIHYKNQSNVHASFIRLLIDTSSSKLGLATDFF